MSPSSWFNIVRRPAFLIPLVFFIWTVSFFGFLSGRVSLTSDAISYYDHIKFFIDQIGRGQFPLWDPNWSGGVPNDFFLRRIGPYNPFFLIVIILNKLGIKFFYAYMIFQASYFFFGMTGFYLLSCRLLKDRPAAFLSFLILTFSVLGSRIFDSYMLLVTVPVIWFFYFLVSFFTKPRRVYAAGMTLAVMFLLTTYIPFYFFIIFLSFLCIYIVVYVKSLSDCWANVSSFLNKNKFFSILCVVAVILAATPGLSFFSDAGKSEIAIPGRHYNTELKHVLAVESQQLNPWSIVEEFFFSSYFTDLSRIVFAVVYVPFFALIMVGTGILIRLNRLFVFLFLWAMALVLFSMPIGFPLYDFLYRHLGFVKYFRNLHFFLWFILLPLFAVLIGIIWKQFIEQCRELPLWTSLVLVGAVHCLWLIFLVQQQGVLITTYLSWVASGCFFLLILSGLKWVKRWMLVLLLGVVVLQPLEVFQHLSRNYAEQKTQYYYDNITGRFAHTTVLSGEVRVPSSEGVDSSISSGQSNSFYYTTDIYQRLVNRADPQVLERYEYYKFYIYDQPPAVDNITRAFEGRPVLSDTDHFRVTRFWCNGISIDADIDSPGFIVFNDVNYPGWTLNVNGKAMPLMTANGAFKGFWLSSGKSKAVLQYGSIQKHLLNWILLAVFYGMFFYVICLYWRRRDSAS